MSRLVGSNPRSLIVEDNDVFLIEEAIAAVQLDARIQVVYDGESRCLGNLNEGNMIVL